MNREALFNNWAECYDATLRDAQGFPFEGYRDVLRKLLDLATPTPVSRVLDLGVGTGALADLFNRAGCRVTGVDFSEEMLTRAQINVPEAAFLRVDLTADLPDVLRRKNFDAVVSSYVFHEFSDSQKLDLLQRLASETLAPGGQMLIADIGFLDELVRDETRSAVGSAWDEDENYWVADQMVTQLQSQGLRAQFWPVSFCAGIFQLVQLQPPADF